jgi:hypothetical protein
VQERIEALSPARLDGGDGHLGLERIGCKALDVVALTY